MIDLIHDPAVDIEAIGAYLDGLEPTARLAATRALARKDQQLLYGKAAASAPLEVHWFADSAQPVEHRGKNSLPVPTIFREFSKVFSLAEDSERLFGYNEGILRPVIGPGCFVAYSTAEAPAAWQDRGSVVIDYFQVPDGPVPSSFPRVVPNSRGLQYFVYHKTRDFMRGVSQHVSIGAAYKGEEPIGQYFVLCK